MNIVQLDETYQIFTDQLPAELISDEGLFEEIWNLHPTEFYLLKIHGKEVRTPRWQQAYEKIIDILVRKTMPCRCLKYYSHFVNGVSNMLILD